MISVLIVDDQRLFVESLQTVLETRASDIEVVGIAIDGRDALEKVAEVHPDVVLMDVRMPVLDGVQATRVIAESYPRVRVMMLTTFDDDQYVVDALKHGAIGYVLKDIPPEQLITAIRAVHGGAMLINPSVARKALLHIGEFASSSAGSFEPEDDMETPAAAHPILKFLTPREIEVLRLIGHGFDNAEIADRLFISHQTVKNHVSIIYSKLNIHDRAKVVRFADAMRHLLEDEE